MLLSSKVQTHKPTQEKIDNCLNMHKIIYTKGVEIKNQLIMESY